MWQCGNNRDTIVKWMILRKKINRKYRVKFVHKGASFSIKSNLNTYLLYVNLSNNRLGMR